MPRRLSRASHGRAGKIEKASGGVLCLDEIGEMPLDLQAYLLMVLEDRMVYRIGEHEGRTVDIQILSMTNRSLAAEVEAGRFRRDLYHRIRRRTGANSAPPRARR
jgi:transcriptional regulator with PAS, ATPase and Fis domain